MQATKATRVTANLFFLYEALGRRQRGAYADSTNLFFYDGENTVKFGFANFLPGPGIDEPLVAFFGQGNYCLGSDANSTNGYFTTNGNRLVDMYGDGTDDDSCIGANPWVWGKQAGAIQGSETYRLQRAPGSNDGMSFFRFYDPNMGRFTQEDPIGFAGGLNLYSYAGNNPASYTDPFGLSPCCNPLKLTVGMYNVASGLSQIAAAAAGAAVGGAGTKAWATVQLALAPAKINRGITQISKAMDENVEDVRVRNVVGLAPFGQLFDDPGEPGPLDYAEDISNRFESDPLGAFEQLLSDFYSRPTPESGSNRP